MPIAALNRVLFSPLVFAKPLTGGLNTHSNPDASWTQVNGTMLNSGYRAPDGTMSAGVFTENSTNAAHQGNIAVTATTAVQVYTVTAYVKLVRGTRDAWVEIFSSDFGSEVDAYISMFDGTSLGASPVGLFTLASMTVTPLPQMWRKAVITYTGIIDTSVIIRVGMANMTYTTNYAGNDAQLAIWGVDFR